MDESPMTNVVIKDADGTTVATAPGAVGFELPWGRGGRTAGILTAPAEIAKPLVQDALYTVDYDAVGQHGSIRAYYTNTFSNGVLQFRVEQGSEESVVSLATSSAEETTRGETELTNLIIKDAGGTTVATAPSGFIVKLPAIFLAYMLFTDEADVVQPMIDSQMYAFTSVTDGKPGSFKGYCQGSPSPGQQKLSFLLGG
jgi:hypothetical protein